MFADEPTGNLDSHDERRDPRRCCATRSTRYGQTTVMVTHDAARGRDRRPRAVPRRRRRSSATSAPLDAHRDPRGAGGGDAAMIARRAQGPRGPQAARAADRARRRPRRRDGQRHAHPHRHDPEGVRRASSRRRTPRPTPSIARQGRSSRAPRSGDADASAESLLDQGRRRCPRSQRRPAARSPPTTRTRRAHRPRRQGVGGRRRAQLRLRRRPVAAARSARSSSPQGAWATGPARS